MQEAHFERRFYEPPEKARESVSQTKARLNDLIGQEGSFISKEKGIFSLDNIIYIMSVKEDYSGFNRRSYAVLSAEVCAFENGLDSERFKRIIGEIFDVGS